MTRAHKFIYGPSITKLIADGLADQQAKKLSATQDKAGEQEDSVVTPAKPTKKPSPPFILKKRAPLGSALL